MTSLTVALLSILGLANVAVVTLKIKMAFKSNSILIGLEDNRRQVLEKSKRGHKR